MLQAIPSQAVKTLLVGIEQRHLGIGHEDDSVGSLKHALARGLVEDLAGDRQQLEMDLEISDETGPDGQQVKEKVLSVSVSRQTSSPR